MPDLPPLPPGARLLSTDEAVERIVLGDHAEDKPDAPLGLAVDAALIDMLRNGELRAILRADGRLAFTRLES
jgi:hypothetical protein